MRGSRCGTPSPQPEGSRGAVAYWTIAVVFTGSSIGGEREAVLACDSLLPDAFSPARTITPSSSNRGLGSARGQFPLNPPLPPFPSRPPRPTSPFSSSNASPSLSALACGTPAPRARSSCPSESCIDDTCAISVSTLPSTSATLAARPAPPAALDASKSSASIILSSSTVLFWLGEGRARRWCEGKRYQRDASCAEPFDHPCDRSRGSSIAHKSSEQ
jgi:hypothetical protein